MPLTGMLGLARSMILSNAARLLQAQVTPPADTILQYSKVQILNCWQQLLSRMLLSVGGEAVLS